ncbi:MAG: TIGR03619 family F420-dependent LLM class oxidoreductase [Alphaproteobacteria bacterium]|nr:TIGR03619 family F420-dependent LLM class oxidoreductase [Alphaproteobacteria bacterium]
MQYGFSIIVRGDAASPATFDAMAERAEALGIDALWSSDHLVMPPFITSSYPGRADGQLPDDWKRTYYQPFSVLNYLAARTTKVRLGTSVLILPMRNPLEVAAQMAELDRLSGGRANFGVGVGWYSEEFAALGYPFKDRGKRTDDGLAIVKKLWTEAKASHDSPYFSFTDTELGPKPVQRPHLPIYIGGNSPAAMRRTARFADAWHPFKITPEGLAETRPVLEAALREAGRSSDGFPIAPKIALTFQDGPASAGQAPSEGRPQDIVDTLRRFRDAGATEFCFDIMTETLPVALDTMERFAQEVRDKI